MVTTGESTCQNKNRFVLMWSRLVYGGWDTSVCSGSSSNVFHLIWSSHESHFRSGTNFCLVSGNSSGLAILAGAWWHEVVWFGLVQYSFGFRKQFELQRHMSHHLIWHDGCQLKTKVVPLQCLQCPAWPPGNTSRSGVALKLCKYTAKHERQDKWED